MPENIKHEYYTCTTHNCVITDDHVHIDDDPDIWLCQYLGCDSSYNSDDIYPPSYKPYEYDTSDEDTDIDIP